LNIIIDSNDSIAKDENVSLADRLKSESIKVEAIAMLRDAISSLLGRTRLCYEYNYARLILLEFCGLEHLWNERITSDKIKKDAVQIFEVASKSELTPQRYVDVQKYFIKTLKLQDYVKI
jgi:hypothetical protein